MKPMMKKRLAKEFKAIEQLENAIKRIMGETGLPTWHNVPYPNFGRSIYGLRKRHVGNALWNEIAIRFAMAQQNLLKKSILKRILEVTMALPMPKDDDEKD
jgi:hypothetical protein